MTDTRLVYTLVTNDFTKKSFIKNMQIVQQTENFTKLSMNYIHNDNTYKINVEISNQSSDDDMIWVTTEVYNLKNIGSVSATTDICLRETFINSEVGKMYRAVLVENERKKYEN